MASILGPGLVLLFCVSQALRDVYFGHVFQGVDFFAVIVLAFLPSTAVFALIVLIRAPKEFAKLRGHGRTVLAANLTTALAWSSYFFGLSRLEPAIVNTLHSGMGPLTVIVLAMLGMRLAPAIPIRRAERLAYVAMALSLTGLWCVVLSGQSGLNSGSTADNLAGLALLAVSGASITVSLLYCKRLHDHGISSDTVTAVRYIALTLLAGGVLLWKGHAAGIAGSGEVVAISTIACALIVLPLFALQVGIARTAPLTGHVLRSLGPVFVFAAQQLDGRMTWSVPTLICIVAYSAAAIAASIAQIWRQQTGIVSSEGCYDRASGLEERPCEPSPSRWQFFVSQTRLLWRHRSRGAMRTSARSSRANPSPHSAATTRITSKAEAAMSGSFSTSTNA